MRHLIHRRHKAAFSLLQTAVLAGVGWLGSAQAQSSRSEASATRPPVGTSIYSQASGGPNGYDPRAYNHQLGTPIEQRNTVRLVQSQQQAMQEVEWREQQRRRRYLDEERNLQAHANPEAPDQSELLRNSRDRDFILHNFRTLYVDARDAQYFGSDQLKAALQRNKGFEALNIRIVDDPHVADAVLKVGYTFAWDYPFELRHQNTTIILLAGKGQGPFSGPLGAADVARQFVNIAKPWRKPTQARK